MDSVDGHRLNSRPVMPYFVLCFAALILASAGHAVADPASASDRAAIGDNAAWSPAEIEAAREMCARVLLQVKAKVEPHPPIRRGACGAPAPVQVFELGSKPSIRLAPPLPLTCAMVAGLARWIDTVVQPVAMTTLAEPIVRLEGISSYQCRNQVGDPSTVDDLSEHALANAIDISTFVTARGRRITVALGWGPIADRASPTAPLTPGTKPDLAAGDRAFLRGVHAGACQVFTTVIGPQSNAAHRDHFHLDLTQADPGDNFCE